MNSKELGNPSTWQDKDGLTYQEQVHREWGNGGPEGLDTFPFRPGDRVAVKSRDTVWDAEGREYDLVVGWVGTVTEVIWDRTWTTHVMVDFPEIGVVCVGWDVLARDEPSNEVKDHEQ